MYSEFSANEPQEFVLKNLDGFSIPATATTQNMILEFYAGAETTPFEKMILPSSKNNKNYGICLTKTKSNNFAYYLTKETRHHIDNLYMVDKLLVPRYGDNVIFSANLESVWNNMSWSDQAFYGQLIWKKASVIDKHEIYQPKYTIESTLNIWKDPRYFVRGTWMNIYGKNYYSNYSSNTEQAGEFSLKFNSNGKASYQIYIPKTGIYDLKFYLTNSNAADINVKNVVAGETIYSLSAPASADGQLQGRQTVPREIELAQGLLYIEVEGSDFVLDSIFLEYLRNEEELRAQYLAQKHEAVRLDVVNAIYYLDRADATIESIDNALLSARFLRDKSVIPKYEDLVGRGYDEESTSMQEIAQFIENLKTRIALSEAERAMYENGNKVYIEGEISVNCTDNMQFTSTYGYFKPDPSTALAVYKVVIPVDGYYTFNYIVSTNNDATDIIADNGFMDRVDEMTLPNTDDAFATIPGSRIHMTKGDNYIYLYGRTGEMKLDKIELVYGGQ